MADDELPEVVAGRLRLREDQFRLLSYGVAFIGAVMLLAGIVLGWIALGRVQSALLLQRKGQACQVRLQYLTIDERRALTQPQFDRMCPPELFEDVPQAPPVTVSTVPGSAAPAVTTTSVLAAPPFDTRAPVRPRATVPATHPGTVPPASGAPPTSPPPTGAPPTTMPCRVIVAGRCVTLPLDPPIP